MNYVNRIKCRIKKEGTIKTILYILFACSYSIYNLILEIMLDLRYSGKLLKGNCKTSYKHLGANDIYHTKYSIMPIIFGLVRISKNDVLVDVGCGKGRVINYWLSRKFKNKIVGLELDPVVARQTASHLSRWKNVSIIVGDAITNLPSDGTIFYFYNPFSEDKVKQFEKSLTDNYKNKRIKIIYYNPKSIHVFENDNWKITYINFENDLGMKRWGRINKYHDLAIIKSCTKNNE